jgi:repressor LexA
VAVDLSSIGLSEGARTFALTVRGDSMIGAHIQEGDVVVLEYREPRDGDVVAALIDGETTLKRFVLDNGRPFLKAENPAYPDLIPAMELIVQGVVVALTRKVFQ